MLSGWIMFAGLPQLNAMRVFESAARLGSFKAAADELHVTPTAVSHQIRSLEARLGTRLFHRQARSVLLTDNGARLRRAANTALHEINSAIRDITLPSTTLTVATTPSFAALWLVPRLGDYQRANPGAEIQLQTGVGIVSLQNQDVIDLAIRYGAATGATGEADVLRRERFGAFYNTARLRKRRGGGSILSRTDLIETRWANPELPPIGWRDWLGQHAPRIRQPRIRQFDSQLHALHAAMAGEGILLCSDVLAASALANGWLNAYQPGRTIAGLAYRLIIAPGRERSPRVQAFKAWIESALADAGAADR